MFTSNQCLQIIKKYRKGVWALLHSITKCPVTLPMGSGFRQVLMFLWGEFYDQKVLKLLVSLLCILFEKSFGSA